MNLPEAIALAKEQHDIGWIWVNDDKEVFWGNERPSRYEGYWGNESFDFKQVFIGKYTGDVRWQNTLKEVS